MTGEATAAFPTTGEVNHRFIDVNGIRMHIAEQGQGPLVILCHGFPECWYTWKYQLPVLAGAGYHVVAPDQRGYGQTDRPESIEAYTILHLVGDMVGLLDALDEERAILIGHDWGANVVWNAALMRPDRFRAVVNMSVPYVPRSQVYGPRSNVRPTEAMKQLVGNNSFYQLYFLEPGLAEAEMEQDVRKTMLQVFYALSGDAAASERWHPILPNPGTGMFTETAVPATLPSWLSEEDLDYFTEQFQRSGFRGGLNWYRNFDRNWELTAPFSGATITQPTLFIWGDRDPVFEVPGTSARVERQRQFVPTMRELLLPGCGHWVQMERATEVNEAIIDFLRNL
jgi:pimeloyl-ACP methyl ester carboxylesterase